MKLFITIVLLIVSLLFITQLYFIFVDNRHLKAELNDLNAKMETTIKDNEKINSEINYFSNPQNLEKELKSKFNYKKPDEKMMIIVP